MLTPFLSKWKIKKELFCDFQGDIPNTYLKQSDGKNLEIVKKYISANRNLIDKNGLFFYMPR